MLGRVPLRDLDRDRAEHRADLALEVTHAGLARVAVDDLEQRVIGDLAAIVGQAVILELLGHEELARDVLLVLPRVTRELDDLEAIAERPRDRIELVRGRDEQHLGEVEVDLEVVVAERRVLLRVQDLEQRRRRVAPKIVAELVDLVEHEHRVVGPGLLDALDDATRQRADVRAPVTADLGLVAHAAERDATELAADRARDAASERRLADARGTREAQDRALLVVLQLADRHVLDDALLDLVEIVVVLVEALAHLGQLDVIVGRHRPRQLDEPLEVRARDRVLRARRLHALQAIELLARDLLRLFGELGLRDLLAELLEITAAIVELAELFLDRLELLAQHVLALVAAHLLLYLGVDPLADLQHLELARQELEDLARAGLEIERLEHVLLLADLELEVARDQIREVTGFGDAIDERAGFFRQLGHELDDPLRDVLEVHHERVELDVGGGRIRNAADLGREERLGAVERADLEARDALQDDAEVVLRELDDLEDPRRAADHVEIAGARILGARVLLRQDPDDRPLLRDRILDEPYALAPADIDGNDRSGEQHGVAQREDGKRVRDFHRLLPSSLGLGHCWNVAIAIA